MKCVLVTNANMDAQGRGNLKCVLEKIGKKESAEKRVKKKRMRVQGLTPKSENLIKTP